MKSYINKFFRKFGFEFKRYAPNSSGSQAVTLKPADAAIGNVLISYIIDPFLLKDNEPVSNAHTHDWESLQMAKTFLNLGYTVDVIDYRDTKFVPKKNYALFVSARTNLQRISQLLNEDCIRIAHFETSHWLFNNCAAYQRGLDLQQRKGASLQSIKWVKPNWAIESTDFATIKGNRSTSSTYAFAQKPFFHTPNPACIDFDWPKQKNFDDCRKNFLWLGSEGLVHKGLDLVLEVFANLPEFQLMVCGPIQNEKDFEKLYSKELYRTPNIQTTGWIDIGSDKFREIANNSIGIIYPSCAEGQAGSVVNCMQAGLIPIVSRESGIDVDDFGLFLKECTLPEITSSIHKISQLPADQLKKMSRNTWEYAKKQHSRENFAKVYKRIIKHILSSRIERIESGKEIHPQPERKHADMLR